MPQDFAHRTRATAAGRPHESLKQLSILSSLWQVLVKLSMMKVVYLPIVVGTFAFFSMLVVSSIRVDASVQLTHEEWLQPEAHDLLKLENTVKKVLVRSGGSAISSLKNLGFSFSETMAMQAAAKKVHSLAHIQVGHAFTREDGDGVIDVYYELNAAQRLHLNHYKQAWHASLEQIAVSSRTVYVQAKIEDSLFLDASKAGLDDRTTMNLVDVFAWDIDFARDLRKGDQFQVLYEEDYNDKGKVIGSTIIAAEFVNQGRIYHAIRHQLSSGKEDYYALNGKSLRKAYLKSPVKYSRISSRFTSARKHPVLGYTRAHKGVDYAARSGTPIYALGDGRIAFAGWKGGYGRLIEIRHGNRDHRTRYGHMRKFARGIHKGVHVKQGQVIGYVGMSGLATGPHLHFEFRVRGRAVNPLRVKHAPAKPVPKAEMAAYLEHANMLQQTLDSETQKWGWG
ncbi:MAG: peptidoglycan DD-metalloendopeptidase family protein [Mariprofundaceae bacterium]|nr:peptidoglycan DD-metalloendopeptidase family protein [Mariprofundaceae bacterium]